MVGCLDRDPGGFEGDGVNALRGAQRGSGIVQRDPGAGACRTPHLGYLQLCLALGGDERMHSDLHAGFGPDRGRDELVAGDRYDPAWQCNRANPDAAERTRGHEVWNPVSGFRSRFVRSARREPARSAARASGMRVVRYSDVDRRTGDPLAADNRLARGRSVAGVGVDLLLRVLVSEHGSDLARH